jgi:CBS domain-containing protein
MAQQPTFSRLRSTLDELGAASDTARLQLHLLALEARQRSSDFGTGIESLEQRLDRSLQQALSAAAEKARQLTRTVQDSLAGHPGHTGAAPDRVDSIMSEGVLVCSADDSLTRPAQIMWELDCGIVPVVDAEQRLEGVITDRDICMAAYTQGRRLHEIYVADVMSRPVHRCFASDPLTRAIAVMAAAQVRRLPVVDAEQRVVGIVSLADLVRVPALLGQRETEQLLCQLLGSVSQRREPALAAE